MTTEGDEQFAEVMAGHWKRVEAHIALPKLTPGRRECAEYADQWLNQAHTGADGHMDELIFLARAQVYATMALDTQFRACCNAHAHELGGHDDSTT